MQEIRVGRAENNELRRIRGWKLFFMLPRMLLQKPGKGGLVPKSKLQERFAQFADGRWMDFIVQWEAAVAASNAKARRTRRCPDSLEGRAERARAMAALGELSSARRALEGEAIARGDEATLAALRDRRRRPPEPREPIPEEVLHHQPATQVVFDNDWFLHNVRSSKKGAAAGPSGMTCDHLMPLLRNSGDSELFCELAQEVAKAEIPRRNRECHSSGKDDSIEETFQEGCEELLSAMCCGGWWPAQSRRFWATISRQPPHHTNAPLPQGRGASPSPTCFRD